MKDLDLGKMFLILIGVLVVGALAATFWVNSQLAATDKQLKTAKNQLNEMGFLISDINMLEEEKKKDVSLNYETPNQYFADLARKSGLDPNRDYETNPRGQEYFQGYVDQEFVLTFKSEKDRERLGKFLVNIHTQSPRFRCVKAKLQLEAQRAKDDLWKATFTILKRDPVVGELAP